MADDVNSGELNSVVFLDIKKAFDTVDHGVLIQNLACYGIKDNSLELIESYLKDRMQCCSVNGELTSMELIVCGVPQGSILGPLLFILYMNDLPEYVDITMFADDISFAKGFKNVNEIQEHPVPAFSKICKRLSINKLNLNIDTVFMIIGTPNSINKLDKEPGSTPYMIVTTDDCRIRRVKLVKSLGLIVDDTLTWLNHIEYITGKVKRGIGVMEKTSNYLDRTSLLMLYRTLVETHCRNCDIIWGQCKETLKDRLQLLQNKAARVITKVKYKDADHLKLICQHGWLTIRNLIKLDLGIFMYKSYSKLLPETAGEFHLPAEKVHPYGTRSAISGNIFLPRYDLSFTEKSIAFSGAKLWNEIPVNVKRAVLLDSFKDKLNAYYLQLQTDT